MSTWPPTPILTTDHAMEAEARDAMTASQQADAAIWSEHFGDRSIDEVSAELERLQNVVDYVDTYHPDCLPPDGWTSAPPTRAPGENG